MEWILAALALGFLGSFHCIGMCGPIALVLPLPANTTLSKATGILIYNTGRILTYATLGALFGLLGKGFILAGYQQLLSIVLGAAILLIVLIPGSMISKSGITNFLYLPVLKIKSALSLLFRQKSYSSLLTVGILSGLLPCGLVYLGVAGAIATGSAAEGSLFMALFGAGTVPAMATVSIASHRIGVTWRNKIRKAVPVMVVLMACMLMLRGMNLGIPYISPELSRTDCTEHRCCHPKK